MQAALLLGTIAVDAVALGGFEASGAMAGGSDENDGQILGMEVGLVDLVGARGEPKLEVASRHGHNPVELPFKAQVCRLV